MNTPLFDTPSQVLAFIRQCVNENNPLRLYAACSYVAEIATKTSIFCQKHAFKALCDIEKTATLERAFLGDGEITEFPSEAATFKLGGHDLRIHCLHIDLERHEGHWRLAKIWQCR
ncbi:hypothetical protein VU08_07205 [Desulfobulbus sp. F5]|nr:hypothetical protein [Desulfobulbus sp. F5]